ncbi:hypothetical protein IV38_GL001449 [Lactobacillus selangorensis]|uniref:6-phosphogluconolactonase n=1 Tax=Lactobacillus selangorensis TaxID=81857 RepID=A0A0R2FIS3_9LACO|nr:lactonase family protein [Lactobacillus selangorensis]KRN28448.1 hypothetical protein IV38_GL001449 [Lactobacillus selangorensis]KRN31949.1 hypothetical protein IV40_GL001236 [Lactobacillus selangorensis]
MQEEFLIGGYTRQTSKGIYKASLDTERGQLSQPQPYVHVDNPTYLAVSAQKNLYTIAQKGDQGGVASYRMEPTPSLLNDVMGAGSPPAYVSLDEARQLVYAANYHTGQVLVYQIEDDGRLKLADIVQHTGKGPKPEQDAAHVHYADLTPENRLVVCDLGMDEVTTYDVDAHGQLTLVATYQTEPGFGPRHIAFNPQDSSIAYLIGELASQLSVLKYDPQTASFTHLQTISLIPDDWTTYNGSAAVRVSSDGCFVYASNRGHNSIVTLKVADDRQRVRIIQRISTEGDFPRDFNLDPTEKYVVAANQKSDNLTLYRRNPETGMLTMIQKDVPDPEGTCVYFLA